MRDDMQVLGTGIDLTDVDRIRHMLAEHGERFVSRCFTAAERAYCEQSTRRRAEHYAARFAAKEAVLKALGTGLRDGITWTDIEVTRSDTGQPGIELAGRAAMRAARLGIGAWQVSLSHTAGTAAAVVIALGIAPGRA